LGEQLISKGLNWVEFKWDMGNITHNGKGIAIISKQLISDNEKTNVDDELKPVIKAFLGLSEIIFIPVEPLDVTGHVDGMVRFIDEKTLVIGAYPENVENHVFMDRLAEDLKANLGEEFSIIRLMNAEPENYSSEGVGSAVGNHLNFLRINNNILFPYYSDEISAKPFSDFKHDLLAMNLDMQVIPIKIPEINKLARKGGVLNCISWQVFN
jgi:agmatine deiminase